MPEKPRRATRLAQTLRNNAADCERLLWLELRQRRLGGHKFSRQIPVGPFIADFVCRRSKLIVEVDGGQHSAQSEADARRTRFLEREGYRLVRFWNNDVLENMQGVLQTIGAALDAGPPPGPLRDGEGENGATPSPKPSGEREGSQ